MLSLLFNLEDGGCMILRNVGLSSDYTTISVFAFPLQSEVDKYSVICMSTCFILYIFVGVGKRSVHELNGRKHPRL
jgi:hypothetical protein